MSLNVTSSSLAVTATTYVTAFTSTAAPFVENNSTSKKSALSSVADKWQFIAAAGIAVAAIVAICGLLIFCCKRHTREARLERAARQQRREEEDKARAEQKRFAKTLESLNGLGDAAADTAVAVPEGDEGKSARTGPDVPLLHDAALWGDDPQSDDAEEDDATALEDPTIDIAYADISEVPIERKHGSTILIEGVLPSDVPRPTDKRSATHTSFGPPVIGTTSNPTPPLLLPFRTVSGVDASRNAAERAMAVRQAQRAADLAAAVRRAAAPSSYRRLKEQLAARGVGGPQDVRETLRRLPWSGRQDLGAFDPQSSTRAFAPHVPDADDSVGQAFVGEGSSSLLSRPNVAETRSAARAPKPQFSLLRGSTRREVLEDDLAMAPIRHYAGRGPQQEQSDYAKLLGWT